MSAAASEIMDEALAAIRKAFYRDAEKEFFQDMTFLRQAVTFPASWLHERGVGLESARYREILWTILGGIRRHGQMGKVRRRAVYLLHCVQEHMRHHGEDYYEDGKRLRRAVDAVLLGTRKRGPAPDSTVAVLAEVHRVLAGRRRATRPAPCKASETPDLFACNGPAKPKGSLKPMQTRAIRRAPASNRPQTP